MSFTRRTLVTFLSQSVGFVLVMATSVIVARVLGPDGKGVYSIALLVPSLLTAFSYLGVGPATCFYIGKRAFPLPDILGNNIISSACLGIIAMVIGALIITWWGSSLFPGVEMRYLFLGLPLIPLQLFFGFITFIFLGLGDFKWYNFFPLFRAVLLLAAFGIFFLGFRFGVAAGIIAEILSFVISTIILFVVVKRTTGGISWRINKEYLKSSYSYGLKVHLANMLTFLHYRVDLFLINIFMNPATVGLYSLSAGMSERIQSIADAAGVVLFSKTASEKSEDAIKGFTPFLLRTILIITMSAAAVLFFLGAWLIPVLYSELFIASVKPFRILLISAVALSGSYILESDLKGRGKPLYPSYAVAGGLFMNIILNLVLIPRFGIVGAAWSTTISYSLSFLILLGIYRKISENSLGNILLIRYQDLQFYKMLLKRIISRR